MAENGCGDSPSCPLTATFPRCPPTQIVDSPLRGPYLGQSSEGRSFPARSFTMRRAGGAVVVLVGLAASFAFGAGKDTAAPAGDARLTRPKDLNGYFPFTPPASEEAWEARKKELREQVLV